MTEEQVTGDGMRAPEAQRAPDGVAVSGLVIYECLLPAVPRSVARFRNELTTVLERHGVSAARCQDIALVVSEAATNAVRYAYPDTSAGPVYVAGTLEREAVTVSVCDCGRGLALDVGRAGLGAGLVLMIRLVDYLEICSAAPVDGTCVHATFDHATAAGAVTTRDQRAAGAARDRGEMLREYVHILTATHSGLAEDSRAVLAEAEHALARSRRSRQERARRRR